MKTFKDYCKFRESSGSAIDVGRNIIGNAALSSDEEQNVSALYSLIDWIMQTHETTLLEFLQRFRGTDAQINFAGQTVPVDKLIDMVQHGEGRAVTRRAIRKTQGGQPEFKDVDEIVPPSADTGAGVGEE